MMEIESYCKKDVLDQVAIHDNKVAGTSGHNKNMKNLVAYEILMFTIEDRKL